MADEMNNPSRPEDKDANLRWEGPQNGKWPQALQIQSSEDSAESAGKPAGEPRTVRQVSPKPVREKPAKPVKEPKKKTKAHKPGVFDDLPDPQEEERSYRPIRSSRDGRIGCLGGIMYAMFIIAVSIALACFGWMAASDVLALNKGSAEVEVMLPEAAFLDKAVDVKDDEGNVTGTKTIRAADIDAVAGVLKDYGLINYKWLFRLYSNFSHADEKLSPGTYKLNTNLDYRALVKKMQAGSGSQLQTLVMFPEGYNMDQIFAKLEESGVCSKADLYEAAANAEYSYAYLEGIESGDPARLEGFLFPDSYYFYQGMQASSAINKFLSNMHYKLTDEMREQAAARGMSIRDVLTVASIIEKEAANDDERALIASVLYNRLAQGMPLQCDSTVDYALRNEDHNGLSTELIYATDSPYNTYLYTGLPPTPICSPGIPSIQAALNPADTRYMFFALEVESKTVKFFITLEEHEAFVATQDYGGVE